MSNDITQMYMYNNMVDIYEFMMMIFCFHLIGNYLLLYKLIICIMICKQILYIITIQTVRKYTPTKPTFPSIYLSKSIHLLHLQHKRNAWNETEEKDQNLLVNWKWCSRLINFQNMINLLTVCCYAWNVIPIIVADLRNLGTSAHKFKWMCGSISAAT